MNMILKQLKEEEQNAYTRIKM